MDFKIENLVKYKITAEIVDREIGVESYDNIRLIRLKSVDHNLLIMEDYLPVIGEVDGFIELVFDKEVKKFNNIHGFYMHKHNHFMLLIEKRGEEDAGENHRTIDFT